MVTIRQIAACLFKTPLSVRALFGNATPPLSLLDLAGKATQQKIDLNIIAVGLEAVHGGEEIEAAVDRLRVLYTAVDLGIGKVSFFFIPDDEADGHEHIESPEEADALVADWGFPGKAIDAFFVLTWTGTVIGRSIVNGPCPAGDEPESGLVVAIEGSTDITGDTLAHEVGHYLGLHVGLSDPAQGFHSADPGNLMFGDVSGGEHLTAEQGLKMRKHCMVHTGCRFFPS